MRFPGGGAQVSIHITFDAAFTAANDLRPLPSVDVNSGQCAKTAREIDAMALTALEVAAHKSRFAAECDDTNSDSHAL